MENEYQLIKTEDGYRVMERYTYMSDSGQDDKLVDCYTPWRDYKTLAGAKKAILKNLRMMTRNEEIVNSALDFILNYNTFFEID
jgi:hypothetical protein